MIPSRGIVNCNREDIERIEYKRSRSVGGSCNVVKGLARGDYGFGYSNWERYRANGFLLRSFK